MTDTITLPRSVIKRALEALKIGHESARDCAETFHVEMAGYKQQRHEALDAEVKQILDAIDALRAALEQEPEAWDNCRGERQCRIWCGNRYCVSHPALEHPQSVTDCHQSQPQGEPAGLLPLDCRGGYANLQLPTAEQSLAVQPQGEQEPVAWMFQHDETGRIMYVDAQQVEWGFEKGNPRWQKIYPVYLNPQPQREPLTEMEIVELRQLTPGTLDVQFVKFARAIERAHEIGGEA